MFSLFKAVLAVLIPSLFKSVQVFSQFKSVKIWSLVNFVQEFSGCSHSSSVQVIIYIISQLFKYVQVYSSLLEILKSFTVVNQAVQELNLEVTYGVEENLFPFVFKSKQK